jgi:hypothetical protein
MNYLLIIFFFIARLMGPVLFATSIYAANISGVQAAAEEKSTSTNLLDLNYVNGLISVHIDHAPLGKVLRELALKTGMQVNLGDPVIAGWPVSVLVKAVPLELALKTILDGFSYALYRVADKPVVIVFSTEPRPSGLKTINVGLKHTPSAEEPDPQPPTDTPGKGGPQSLDEFQPITIEEPSFDPEMEDEQVIDSSTQLAQEQEYKEVLLRRALDALKSEHKHLHIEAIEQLAGLEDIQATEAIVQAASSGTGLDQKSRLQAVGVLWQHAANLKYTDATSVNALKQLAEDSNENIRSIARQALEDMTNYQNSAQ